MPSAGKALAMRQGKRFVSGDGRLWTSRSFVAVRDCGWNARPNETALLLECFTTSTASNYLLKVGHFLRIAGIVEASPVTRLPSHQENWCSVDGKLAACPYSKSVG